ncbi:MAG TPA: hypothetical protein VFG10_05700 [Saprospiraceae bacterium]|nr:hypothetical protein [Saprospiraceae bacterium]
MKKLFFILLIFLGISYVGLSQGVGIGTISPSPSAILDIKSSTKGMIFPRTSSSTRIGMTGVKGLTVYDTTMSQLYYHTGITWVQIATGPAQNNYWSAFGSHIFNNNAGNIGIGTVSPAHKLSLNGDMYITSGTPTLHLGGDGDADVARILWQLPSNDTDFAITQSLNKLFISRNSGALGFVSDLVVSDNGYIGVGVVEPLTKLHVEGGSDVGNASGGFLQLGSSTSTNVGFDNNEIQARSNGAVSRLTLNYGGGGVQIGNATTPAAYQLSVNGKVICEELKIQDSNNWPDYVFGENYSLKNFDELRNFIDVNHHLPNIPDAATIEKNGIEIGDMQKRMMEKIEELTLYILQLEEKTKILEQKVEALRQ